MKLNDVNNNPDEQTNAPAARQETLMTAYCVAVFLIAARAAQEQRVNSAISAALLNNIPRYTR